MWHRSKRRWDHRSPASRWRPATSSCSISPAAVILDSQTLRPEIESFGLDANYTLTEIVSGKTAVTGSAVTRVTYNVPGQQQRFAKDRGLRDAETRAAKEIAEQIRSRLASYFVAGP